MPECTRDHGRPAPEGPRTKKASEEEVDGIVQRLYTTHTQSWNCSAGTPAAAEDLISKKNPTGADVKSITERLSTTYIKSQLTSEEDQAKAEDILSRKVSSAEEVNGIAERLYTTHTLSWTGQEDDDRSPSVKIGKENLSSEEMKEIYHRLNKTHTVSSANTGVIRHPKEPPKPPGYGMKMLPIIEGLDTRFIGHPAPQEKVNEVIQKLTTTQTTASQARKDNPKVLLYPERTTLMNNVERIRAYQESGSVAKQNMLQRREKWFN
ncbi:hypothetical protein CAPTEDRAFT_222587 [Capitella teleta]|uniref:Uncharacterized protein n=1 Tax=Capitella teleta TaxID=283909 RepID=R7VCK3_CAPTE|nr:hypothetical protein CAPTEDRAFT_222587 [Capitella teleta]|eukprot:ELU14041.1 hypothetical protein CAPTEDRAFT_222587 [Capitella teleta]